MKITLNPDPEYVKIMKKKLKANNGYCPSDLIKNKDTKCMCKEFRDQDYSGFCGCGLYYKDMEE